jgi:hypothetical protein
MPAALSTKRRFPVSLQTDIEDFPEINERPKFTFRPVTGNEWIELSEMNQTAREKKGAEAVRLMYEIIRAPLVGWENLRSSDPDLLRDFNVEPPADGGEADLPFDPAQLDKLLTPGEAVELMMAMLNQQKPQETDRKN